MNALPISLLFFGFLMGIKHVFEADHIAAVSTIAANHKSIRKSSLIGIFWGIGHTMALLVAAVMILLLKIKMLEKIALSLEMVVGLMLIFLGINVLLNMKKNKIHLDKHKHGKEEHIHFHSHVLGKSHEHEHLQLKKSLFIGVIHGLAGSAALTLLVLAAINSFFIGLFYVLIFGIGSILGMSLISAIISLPSAFIPNRLGIFDKTLRLSAGLFSIFIGSVMVKQIILNL